MVRKSPQRWDRRDVVKTAAAASLAAAGTVLPQDMARGATSNSDLIRDENAKPGASDWQLTRVRVDESTLRSPWIEGFCSKQSATAGEALEIFVSTNPPQRFQIEIFRTGYYGGLGARHLQTLGPFAGKVQPTPHIGERRIRECRWEPTTALTIPDDWPSGVYLGRLTTLPERSEQPYWQSFIVFIVRDERPADILFQCSDNTWQCYNEWPDGYSVYTHPDGNQGPWADVSFDRPYAKYPQIYENPQSIGSGEWLCFEFPFAYWLEQHGYDVTYCSNSDMLTPERARKCKAFLSVGHDEYWDIRQYETAVALRDAGVNLLFFSGNAVCWVSPYRPGSNGQSSRIIFRGGPYGAQYQWAELREREHGPFPHRGPDEGYLIGARNVEPVNGGGDWIVTRPEHWVFEGTGLKRGDGIPGLVGWEYHGDPPNDLAGLEIVAGGTAWQGGVRPQQWAATIYPGPANNFVFNASTIFWCQGLSSPPGHMLPWSHWSRPHGPDPRVQQITHNLLRSALRE
jgi:hypothetical protein